METKINKPCKEGVPVMQTGKEYKAGNRFSINKVLYECKAGIAACGYCAMVTMTDNVCDSLPCGKAERSDFSDMYFVRGTPKRKSWKD